MILKSMEDVLDRYSHAVLSLFDKANRYEYDDADVARKSKELFMIYLPEVMLSMVDEVLRAKEGMRGQP